MLHTTTYKSEGSNNLFSKVKQVILALHTNIIINTICAVRSPPPATCVQVYISGSYDGWQNKLRLTKSHDNFVVIVELPEGEHEYKFMVDGVWKIDPKEVSVYTDHLKGVNCPRLKDAFNQIIICMTLCHLVTHLSGDYHSKLVLTLLF